MCGADSRERTHSRSPQGVDLQRTQERKRRGRGEGEREREMRGMSGMSGTSECGEGSDSEVQVRIQTDSR